ncbi:MAG: hypothetical protein MCS20_01250, partial [Candidatus Phytoplasma mali]|nr:hypothetical protein [Candidatus Phytoplasma australiense]MBZ7920050.1 hypothetical protein [Candidatus Karelsulcia muelleri]MCG7202025.1 hypothetical protein [Candidatus Phytoplasma mali]MCZ8632123.1 hypothetical protein [Spiroplasma sp. Tabriz.8]
SQIIIPLSVTLITDDMCTFKKNQIFNKTYTNTITYIYIYIYIYIYFPLIRNYLLFLSEIVGKSTTSTMGIN